MSRLFPLKIRILIKRRPGRLFHRLCLKKKVYLYIILYSSFNITSLCFFGYFNSFLYSSPIFQSHFRVNLRIIPVYPWSIFIIMKELSQVSISRLSLEQTRDQVKGRRSLKSTGSITNTTRVDIGDQWCVIVRNIK